MKWVINMKNDQDCFESNWRFIFIKIPAFRKIRTLANFLHEKGRVQTLNAKQNTFILYVCFVSQTWLDGIDALDDAFESNCTVSIVYPTQLNLNYYLIKNGETVDAKVI